MAPKPKRPFIGAPLPPALPPAPAAAPLVLTEAEASPPPPLPASSVSLFSASAGSLAASPAGSSTFVSLPLPFLGAAEATAGIVSASARIAANDERPSPDTKRGPWIIGREYTGRTPR